LLPKTPKPPSRGINNQLKMQRSMSSGFFGLEMHKAEKSESH